MRSTMASLWTICVNFSPVFDFNLMPEGYSQRKWNKNKCVFMCVNISEMWNGDLRRAIGATPSGRHPQIRPDPTATIRWYENNHHNFIWLSPNYWNVPGIYRGRSGRHSAAATLKSALIQLQLYDGIQPIKHIIVIWLSRNYWNVSEMWHIRNIHRAIGATPAGRHRQIRPDPTATIRCYTDASFLSILFFFLSSLSLQWLSLLLLLDKPIVISNVSWCRRRKFNIHARANNSARCN